MKLKIKIAGPKVHHVGYRYFLMSMAMSNRIRMFEAHNIESDGIQEVLVFVDGEEKAVLTFRGLIGTSRPARSEVSNIAFEDFNGEIMRIVEYAQFCSTVQLNKAIPVLLDIRDDIKEMKDDIKAVRKNTDMIHQISEDIKDMKSDIKEMKGDIKDMKSDIKEMKGDIKDMKSDIKEMKGDIKEMKSDIKEMKSDIKEMKGDIKEMKSDIKVIRKTTDATLEEIKGLREEIQPDYRMDTRQAQPDIGAIRDR